MPQEQVKVLALTDHDTLSGVPEAVEAARKYGIKIIPGVEISSIFHWRLVSCLRFNTLHHAFLLLNFRVELFYLRS